jgi:hypothetical protein
MVSPRRLAPDLLWSVVMRKIGALTMTLVTLVTSTSMVQRANAHPGSVVGASLQNLTVGRRSGAVTEPPVSVARHSWTNRLKRTATRMAKAGLVGTLALATTSHPVLAQPAYGDPSVDAVITMLSAAGAGFLALVFWSMMRHPFS